MALPLKGERDQGLLQKVYERQKQMQITMEEILETIESVPDQLTGKQLQRRLSGADWRRNSKPILKLKEKKKKAEK